MKKILLVIVMVVLLLFLGCVIFVGDDDGRYYNVFWEQCEYNNCKYIFKLELDVYYEDVICSMGVVDFNELLRQDGYIYWVLYYCIQWVVDDGIIIKDECMLLVFEDNCLIGWGDEVFCKF